MEMAMVVVIMKRIEDLVEIFPSPEKERVIVMDLKRIALVAMMIAISVTKRDIERRIV